MELKWKSGGKTNKVSEKQYPMGFPDLLKINKGVKK
jgi:hypothetical protein